VHRIPTTFHPRYPRQLTQTKFVRGTEACPLTAATFRS